MSFEEAQQLIGTQVGVWHGPRLFIGVLERVEKPRRRGRSRRETSRVTVRLRTLTGVEETAMFELEQLIDLKEPAL